MSEYGTHPNNPFGVPRVFKVCTCCGKTYTKAQWNALKYVGIQSDDVETIEMRDCICKSTLAVVVPKE